MKKRNVTMFGFLKGSFLLMALAAVCLFSRPVKAESGALQLELRTVEDEEKIPGATMLLYKVAEYSGEDITLTDAFAATGITLEDLAERMPETNDLLDDFLDSHGDIEPVAQKVTNADGIALFDDLSDGIYFIRYDADAASEADYDREVTVQSFTVALPTLKDGVFERRLVCFPKCEITIPETEPETTEPETTEPETTEPETSETQPTETPPDTGDSYNGGLWWTLLTVSGLMLTVMIVLCVKKDDPEQV